MDDRHYIEAIDRQIQAQNRKKAEAKAEYERQKKAFLNSYFLERLIAIESGGNPHARAGGNSTARGLYQMTKRFREDGEKQYKKLPFYDPSQPVSEDDLLFSGNLFYIDKLRNTLKRDPDDWEVYAAYNLGYDAGPRFLQRYHKSFKQPWDSGGEYADGVKISFEKKRDKNNNFILDENGNLIYEDYMGKALDNNKGIKHSMFAAAHNIYSPNCYKDPYNLDSNERATADRLLKKADQDKAANINTRTGYAYGAFTVKNLARYYKEKFGGWDNSRTWDGSPPPNSE